MPVFQYPDMMSVDISFVFEDEVPARNHGQQMDGEKLVEIGPHYPGLYYLIMEE